MNNLKKNFRIGAYDPSINKWVVIMKTLKITVHPYIIFLEQLTDEISSLGMNDKFNKFEIVFLDPPEMEYIAALPGRRPTKKVLVKRLNENKVCIAAKLGKEIAAFTWYDLKECDIKSIKGRLKDDEAYLFDAFTVPAYRGKGLAPFMRYRSYQELNKLDKHRFFSFSDYSNTPALRFKEKLKAKPLEMRLAVRFGGIGLNLRIKRYTKSISKFRSFYLRIWVKGIKVIDGF